MDKEELKKRYEESGLSQIAFNSNGQDFYPETIRELLQWSERLCIEARIEGAMNENVMGRLYLNDVELRGKSFAETELASIARYQDFQKKLKELKKGNK